MVKRNPRQELTERAIRAYRYAIRGITAPEIAQLEGIPRRTVYWLLQEGGRILGGHLKTLTQAGLYRELFLHHRERTKELWFLFSRTKQDHVKVACLVQLAEEDERLLHLAERMGIIGQWPVKLEGAMTWVDLVKLAQETRSKKPQQFGQPGS